MTDFAQRHMQKCGWSEGRGLGRTESGMKSAIKVKLKNNTNGLGHDQGSDFSFHWWDHIFNKAASSFKVNDTDDGQGVLIERCEAKKQTPLLISTKRGAVNRAYNKNLLYGTFVKSGTYDGSQPIVDNTTTVGGLSDDSDDSSDDDDGDDDERENDGKNGVINDMLEKMFKKTGLTGHKAARHGHSLNGKLQRLINQEESLLAKLPSRSSKSYSKLGERDDETDGDCIERKEEKRPSVVEKTKTKMRKKLQIESSYSKLKNVADYSEIGNNERKVSDETKETKTIESTTLTDIVQTEHTPTTNKQKKKKKKKKKKLVEVGDNTELSSPTVSCLGKVNMSDVKLKVSTSITDVTSKVGTSINDVTSKLKGRSRKHKLDDEDVVALVEEEPTKKRKKKKVKN